MRMVRYTMTKKQCFFYSISLEELINRDCLIFLFIRNSVLIFLHLCYSSGGS
jgi:hypothetical protein